MTQSMFIVWRESVEALLVIGILQAWVSRQQQASQLLRYVWAGAALGLLLSGVLAGLILLAGEAMSGTANEWFQASLALVASLLIVQMVGWMHRNARTLKHDLTRHADQRLSRQGGLGLLVLALLAVSREGSETVVFLYGAGARLQGPQLGLFAVGALAGLVLSLLTVSLLHSSRRFISWPRFFAISEAILLLLGAALLVSGIERVGGQLLAMDWPEAVYRGIGDALWDSSAILDDGHGLGGFLADFTGYRASPSAMTLLVWLGYWGVVAGWLWPRKAENLPCPT
ncbi:MULTISPECIES: FTR1 family protein [Pseudomonas]|uniref:High-affinity iron transporter n=1 Tax=Pseudomonas kilonensis TaxID=132476 RepID=A0ABY0ZHP7_9PSED|nr:MULTISPECIES: FTR1 family protein [Pseudomonas]EPJ77603.1 FTR1 family iron permease [Pseudomonas sp. CFII68]OPG69732.1 FTR1 family iron permease [Pseudomonas ogarae]OPG78766.1 FTR1 family iron permease [Pseudomonas ogarae]PBJ04580.1 Ferrous iron permease EfeU [Pseudomonas ogarae]PBJ23189.1 Ferrous iron permease EfeU [Pseudomonas ogarae]